MLTRTLGLLILSTLLALSMAATAQTFNVGFEGGGDPVEIAPGESTSVDYTVYLEGDDFNCLGEREFPVNLTASGSQGLSVAVDPGELVFGNTQGIHASDTAAGGYNESGTASLTITAPETVSSSFSSDVTLTGTFPGGDYGPNPDEPTSGSCGPSGNFPSATGETIVRVNVVAPATDGDDTDGGAGGGGGDGNAGNGTDGGDGDDGDDGNGIPLPAWVVPAGLIGAAMLTRRRAE